MLYATVNTSQKIKDYSVADPDLGSGTQDLGSGTQELGSGTQDLGSGIRCLFDSWGDLGSGIRNRFFPDPGSQTHIFESLMTTFWVKSSIIL